MLTDSFTLILLSLAISLPPLIFLFLAIINGQFERLDSTAESIFEENELRYARPWESSTQASARLAKYGVPLNNPLKEWGRWL